MYIEQLQADPLNLKQRKYLVITAIECAVRQGYRIEPFLKSYKNGTWSNWNTSALLDIIEEYYKANTHSDKEAKEELEYFFQTLEKMNPNHYLNN